MTVKRQKSWTLNIVNAKPPHQGFIWIEIILNIEHMCIKKRDIKFWKIVNIKQKRSAIQERFYRRKRRLAAVKWYSPKSNQKMLSKTAYNFFLASKLREVWIFNFTVPKLDLKIMTYTYLERERERDQQTENVRSTDLSSMK